MATNEEHFLTRWELEASTHEVFDLVADAASLPRWWPAVFLDARVLDPGDAHGVGRVVEVRTKAFLPLTLTWRFRVTGAMRPTQIAVETSGDLAGIGAWFFDPAGKRVVVRFHFWGHVERPLARALPTVSRPLFAASHRWAMERGFTSLLLEVWRRRTTNEEARAWLPRPPGPTFPHNLRRWWAGAP